jgi:small-conductance mechanosensitive channel
VPSYFTLPLLIAVGVAVLALLVAGFYAHERQNRRLAWGGALWLALTLGYLRTGDVPVLIHRLPTDPLARALVQAYDTLWWLAGAWLVVNLMNVVLWRWLFPGARQPGGRKLIADLMSTFIYLAAFLAILAFAFDQDISGVLATSGVVAIVIGLALQTSLGEIVSGLFMSVEAPYRAGDWITIDDKIDGQVVETNWRATRLKTRTDDYVIVPNSTIAKANIVNRYFPGKQHIAQFLITIDSRTPPERAIATLRAAAAAATGIQRDPPPEVLILNLTPKAIEYRITYHIDDFAEAPALRSELAQRVWHHLDWAGIRMDEAPILAPATALTDAERATALEKALTRVILCSPLSSDERATLATRCRTQTVPAGTTLVTQGADGDSMYLISEGVMVVRLRQPETGLDIEVARLGPGDYFGEMSLLTGAKRSATVRALTPVCVHELTKADLAPTLMARPALASELGKVLAARQKALVAAGHATGPHDGSDESYAERISTWISSFFHA